MIHSMQTKFMCVGESQSQIQLIQSKSLVCDMLNTSANSIFESKISNNIQIQKIQHDYSAMSKQQLEKIKDSIKQKKELRKLKKQQKTIKMLSNIQSLPKRVLRSYQPDEHFQKMQGEYEEDSNIKKDQFLKENQQKQLTDEVEEEEQTDYIECKQQKIIDLCLNQNQSHGNQVIGINQNNKQQHQQQDLNSESQRFFNHIDFNKNQIEQNNYLYELPIQSPILNYNQKQINYSSQNLISDFYMDEELKSFPFNSEEFSIIPEYNNFFQFDEHDEFLQVQEYNNSIDQFDLQEQLNCNDNNNEKYQLNHIQIDDVIDQKRDFYEIQQDQIDPKSLKIQFNSLKLYKNNFVKNLMYSFKRFISQLFVIKSTHKLKIKNENEETQNQKRKQIIKIYFGDDSQIDEQTIQMTCQSVLNLYNKSQNHKQCLDEKVFLLKFEKYLKNKVFNQHSLSLLMHQSSFSFIFQYFLLENFATNWVKNSKLLNQNMYLKVIELLIKF